MNKEYIYDWDELQNFCDDRGRLTPDEAAAYLALSELDIPEEIFSAEQGPDWWLELIVGNMLMCRKKDLEGTKDNPADEMVLATAKEAENFPYTFKGRDFTMAQIKDTSPQIPIWFMQETCEWSIGRPTWRQIAKNLRLRIYIRIS